jgi:hypothetical protein
MQRNRGRVRRVELSQGVTLRIVRRADLLSLEWRIQNWS